MSNMWWRLAADTAACAWIAGWLGVAVHWLLTDHEVDQ